MGNRLDVVPVSCIFEGAKAASAEFLSGSLPWQGYTAWDVMILPGKTRPLPTGYQKPVTSTEFAYVYDKVKANSFGSEWISYLRDRMWPLAQRSAGTKIPAEMAVALRVVGPTWAKVFERTNFDAFDLRYADERWLGTTYRFELPDGRTIISKEQVIVELKSELAKYLKGILASPTPDEAEDLAALYYITGDPNLSSYAGKSRWDWPLILNISGSREFNFSYQLGGIRYSQIAPFAWGLDLRDFVDPPSGVRQWIGPDGTLRGFYTQLAKLTSRLSAYPWPSPPKYWNAAFAATVGGEVIQSIARAGITALPEEIDDWITLTLISNWSKASGLVNEWAEDAAERRAKTAMQMKIFITVFTMAVGAAVAAYAKSAADAAAVSAAPVSAGTQNALGVFQQGIKMVDKQATYAAAKGMHELAEAMTADSPAFSAQVDKTAQRTNPEGYAAYKKAIEEQGQVFDPVKAMATGFQIPEAAPAAAGQGWAASAAGGSSGTVLAVAGGIAALALLFAFGRKK